MVILKSFKQKSFLVKSGEWECVVNASDAEEAASKAVEQAMQCFAEAGLEDFSMGFLVSCQEILEDLEKTTYLPSSTILANNGHHELAKEIAQ